MEAPKFRRTGIDVRDGLLNDPVCKPIRVVYEYVLTYLLMDFINYLPNFLSGNKLYNTYFGLKAQNIGIERVVFIANKRIKLF